MSAESMWRGLVRRGIGRFARPEFWDRFVAHAALQHEFNGDFSRAAAVATREGLWDRVIDSAGRNEPHIYLEFGVWEGYSMRHFSKAFTHPGSRLYGFDSFEGLPSDWGSMSKGTFTTGGKIPDMADSRVEFVPGWFQNTVDAALEHALAGQVRPSVIVHFDADLYSSTLYLMARLHQHLDSYRVVFDEFPGHECRALLNFRQAFGCEVTLDAFTRSPNGLFPMQVSGRIDNRRGRYAVS